MTADLRTTLLQALASRGMGSYGANEVADVIMAHPAVAAPSTRSMLINSTMFEALKTAERFMAGFEDDPLQDGINEKLATIRGALVVAGRAVSA